jgi:hypothetical protein
MGGGSGDADGTRPPLSTDGNDDDDDDDDNEEEDNDAGNNDDGEEEGKDECVFGDHEAADRSAGDNGS